MSRPQVSKKPGMPGFLHSGGVVGQTAQSTLAPLALTTLS
jgi:hypothetical protein